MGPDDGVLAARIGPRILPAVAPAAVAVVPGAVVDRDQPAQERLHRLRQRVVRRRHAGEQRVAARIRHGVQAQDGTHRRLRIARHVGMPGLARYLRRVGVRMDPQDLRVALRSGRVRMDVQLPEPPPEILLLVQRDVLVPEEDDPVLHQRIMHLGELMVAERARQIDAADLRTHRRRQGTHPYGFVWHDSVLPSAGPARPRGAPAPCAVTAIGSRPIPASPRSRPPNWPPCPWPPRPSGRRSAC